MSSQGTWGSDIEIFAASSLLSTDIYVYTKVGNSYKWHKFSRSMLDSTLPSNKTSIYLQHTNGVHFDVVLDVNTETSKTIFPDKVDLAHEKKQIDGNTKVINKDHFNKSSTKMPNKISQNSVCAHEERNYINSSSKKQDHQNNVDCALFDHNQEVFFSACKNSAMFHKSIQYVIKQCTVCNEAWPCKSNLNCQSDYTCARCNRDKKVPKKFSFENLMIPSSVPTELQSLTQIEEMLISRALPIMKIFINAGGQRGYSGHCINLPQKVAELANSLPRCPKNIPIIVGTMKGNNSSFRDVTVRKQKVENALCWLVQHNPLYHNISIDKSALAQLPSDGVPADLVKLETMSNDINSVCNKVLSLNSHVDEDLFDHTDNSSSFLPVNINDQLKIDAIKKTLHSAKISWPTIENEPLNEYSTPFLATMAYPSLFPDSKGDPTNPGLLHEIPFLNKVQHLIKFAEKIGNKWVYRFASHPRFSYWALNMIQRKRTLQQSAIFLKQNPAEAHLTIDQLCNMAFSKNSSSFMLKLFRYVGNITGSPSYWFKVREDLKAIISHKEPPTKFFTFSAADLYWPELHALFQSSSKDHDISADQKRENVINNPHIVDWYFTKRIENFISIGCTVL